MSANHSPFALYESFLATVDGRDEAERVKSLRGHLAQPPTSWPSAPYDVVEESGVTVGYLTRGLLSIHRFALDVRQALAVGLPFAVARLVNGLPTAEARARALVPLAAGAGYDGALLPRSVAAAVEFARAERRALEAQRPADVLRMGEDRRVLPDDAARPPRHMPSDVWLFEPVAGAPASEEPLAALLARTLPRGGYMVAATAGRGTIASVARRHGVRCRSGDMAPGAPFVVEADASARRDDRGVQPTDLHGPHGSGRGKPMYYFWYTTVR